MFFFYPKVSKSVEFIWWKVSKSVEFVRFKVSKSAISVSLIDKVLFDFER